MLNVVALGTCAPVVKLVTLLFITCPVVSVVIEYGYREEMLLNILKMQNFIVFLVTLDMQIDWISNCVICGDTNCLLSCTDYHTGLTFITLCRLCVGEYDYKFIKRKYFVRHNYLTWPRYNLTPLYNLGYNTHNALISGNY